MDQTDDKGYQVRLSTITRTSTKVRHDYPVEEYNSGAMAMTGAVSFIDHFTGRLREGSVSKTEPKVNIVRETIQDFTG